MAFGDNLSPAAFRGVGFGVEEADISAGRRTQVHEYPQRDKPYVEDLGRGTRVMNITAFLVGPTYIDQANQLLSALEEPGPGMLLHPWFGQLNVSVKELGRVRFNRALNFASVEMSFIEAGELDFPSASASTQAASATSADALANSAINDFMARFNVNGALSFVNAAAHGDINRIFQMATNSSIPGMAALSYISIGMDVTTAALQAINDPATLGNTILQRFSVFNLIASGKKIDALLHGTVKASTAYNAPAATYPLATPDANQQYQNTVALYDMARRSLLVQAVGLSSQLPATVLNDTLAMRDLVIAALDAESLTASDDVYQALQDARTAVWTDLTERSRSSVSVVTYTPPQSMPMLAIANDYYGDATRADEISTRNDVRNPLFVPAQPLKLLSA